jgi:hypothetical protein
MRLVKVLGKLISTRQAQLYLHCLNGPIVVAYCVGSRNGTIMGSFIN